MILFYWMTNSPPVGILCLLAEVQRQMLHAWRLEILHPHTSERMRFEAPLPDDMERLIAARSALAGRHGTLDRRAHR